MKPYIKILKWVIGQSRSYMFPVILITVLGTILSFCYVLTAILSKNLIDAAAEKNIHQAVQAASAFSVIILMKVGIQSSVSILSARTFEKLSNSIRQGLFSRIIHSQWLDITKYHSEDVLTRMTSDVGILSNGIVNILPGIVSLGIRLLAALAALLAMEPMLAVLTFVLAPCAILLSHFLGQKFKDYHIKIQESEGRYRTFIQEQLQNILVVKAFCREKESVCESEKLQNQRLRWVTSRSKINTAGSAILSMGYWLGYLTAFIWGAFRLSEGAATFGTLAAFIQLVEQVQEPFICLAYDLPQLITSMASAERLMELDELQREKNLENLKEWNSAGICLEKVSFSYNQSEDILVNANIRIQPGEIVALAGMSGEGKTTLIRLLLSLIRQKSGKVCFFNSAGHKTESSAAFRHFISYVPQGNTLFSGTIEENLRIGRPDATEKDIEQALQAANALDFIKKLPGGIHTKIGENGYGLSEGQAQRLSIARALIKKAPVLILDEATSALDIHTEKGILQSVKKLGASRTCIIITHRPTAYEVCDRVLKIQNGQLMEFCNPNRLSRGTEAV